MAQVNFFDKAKTVVPAPKSKIKKNEVFEHVEGLQQYAVLDTAIKTLKGLQEVVGSKIRETLRDTFIEKGTERGAKPENFKGMEGAATASMQVRKRTSAAKLDETQIEMLNNFGLPFETVVEKPETFIVNPKYMTDMKLLEKMNNALNKVKGLPEDIFLAQEPVTKSIVTEETEDALYKLGDNEVVAVFDLVETLAIRPTLDRDKMDTKAVFAEVNKMVGRK